MRIFITHTLSMDEALKTGVSVAATNFSINLISSGVFDCVYSILPPCVKVKINDSGAGGIRAVYCQLLRRLSLVKFAAVAEQVMLFHKIPSGSHVWLYNITPLNGILVKLLRRFKPSVKLYTIVLDFTPGESASERWLPTINSCNGRISVSLFDHFNQNNTVCLPGVTPLEKNDWPTIASLEKEFILSGQLSDNISLLNRLLPIFAAHPDWILNITGIAPMLAKEYSKKYTNIRCHGKCSYIQFLDILHKSPFLLSTRDPKMPENQCNFPSKIIEGLLHNRIIISTIDYPQLSPVKYIKVDAENLEDNLIEIVNTCGNSLLEYANQAELTNRMFNAKRWAEEIKKIESYKL